VWFRRRAIPFVMPASPGGSVVDQSLLRQAADRGVTICFADLDGADGLWVPEERTVLVNRGLSEAKVAEVIEHELGHVMIDDQHADLDAGKEVLVGQPPTQDRRRQTVVLAAALSLVAVVGGVMYGIHTARGPDKLDRVAPNPNAPGLTAHETAGSPSLSPSRGPDGQIVYVTVTAPAPSPNAPGSPMILPTDTPTVTKRVPVPTATRSPAAPPSAQPTASESPAPPPTSDPPVTPPPTVDPTTAPPSSPAAGETAGGGVGDTGDGGIGGTDSGSVVTEPATVGGTTAP
jgi:hypothetical protein